MRRIVKSVPSENKNLPALIEQLGAEYKDFKKQNPERRARLPATIKARAKYLHEAGADIKTLAKATGLQPQSIKIWLDYQNEKPKRAYRKRNVKPLAPPVIATSQPLVGQDLLTPGPARDQDFVPKIDTMNLEAEIQGLNSQAPQWVRLRIAGREIEIARGDLGLLLAVATEPPQKEQRMGSVQENFPAITDGQSYSELISQYEKILISDALTKHGTIAGVSKALKISRSTLDARRRKLGLF